MLETPRPTLLSSCAKAATAAEARFRVPYPNSRGRASRIFALDQGAAEAMYRITEEPWHGAHFLTVAPGAEGLDPEAAEADAVPLTMPDGAPAKLTGEVAGADVVVLLSSTGKNAGAAEVIAREAWKRHTMIAALALAGGREGRAVDRVVNALRPLATVLVVARDDDFIPAMLSALRA
jgi:hypothetical protein